MLASTGVSVTGTGKSSLVSVSILDVFTCFMDLVFYFNFSLKNIEISRYSTCMGKPVNRIPTCYISSDFVFIYNEFNHDAYVL